MCLQKLRKSVKASPGDGKLQEQLKEKEKTLRVLEAQVFSLDPQVITLQVFSLDPQVITGLQPRPTGNNRSSA